MRYAQSLTPDFPEYLTMLIKLFNQAISSPKTTRILLQMHKDNTGALLFQQVMEYEMEQKKQGKDGDKKTTVPYKTLQLLACGLYEGDEDKIKHHIKYRHKIAKVQLENMQLKLSQICAVIKDKNPSLVK